MSSRRTFLHQLTAATALTASGLPSVFAHKPKAKIPLSIFSKHLQFLDYAEMAKAAKEIGFDGIDLTVRNKGHVAPERALEDLPRAAEAIRKAGMKLDMMTTGIKSIESPHAEDILRTAAKEGVKYYRMGSIKYDKAKSILDNLEQINKDFKKLEALNREIGIKGAYQNHAGTNFGSSVWDIHMAMEGIDSEWLGIQYDIKHATAEGGRSWPNGLDLIHKRIHTLDIKDFLWQENNGKWKDTHVPLGEGMVNFQAFFQRLADYQMAPPISIHYEYDLGGADHGHREIKMPASYVLASMKRDIEYLRILLAEAGL